MEVFLNQLISFSNRNYSLGLILYEAITGRFAFKRENMTEDDLIELIIKAEFNYNDKILKTYPETAVAVLRRMLQVSALKKN